MRLIGCPSAIRVSPPRSGENYASSGSLTHELVVGYWADAGESIDAYQAASDFVRDNGANKD